jgi:short-subunit dehydrogenase
MNGPQRVWLTGASSGLGAQLAEKLLGQGVLLAVSARSVGPLLELEKRFPGQVLLAPGDLTDADQVRAIGERIREHWGALDQVILNAGTCEYIDVQRFEAAMIERVTQSNLFASAYCIEAALPLLRQGNQPHLVGVASAVTFLPLTRSEAYGASKAAVRYLYQSLQVDLKAEGIDVTVVSPGFVKTPLTDRNDFAMPMLWSAEKAAAHIAKRLPKRPMEIAFPGLFITALRALACLPRRLSLHLTQRMVRDNTSRDSEQA